MDKLPKDMVIKLTEELSPQDFINFCASETSSNVIRICNMSELWIKRLNKDFPLIVKEFPKVLDTSKKIYLEVFLRISKMAETFTETVLREYGNMRNFLNASFKPFLYQLFYNLCSDAIINVLKSRNKSEYEDDWLMQSVYDTYNMNVDNLAQYFPGTKYGIDSLYEFQNKWEEEIEYPLRAFVEEILALLEVNFRISDT